MFLILFVVAKGRRCDGENTAFYFLWYGIGRFWIEGLRTDSFYLFDWMLFGEPVRVSQALSLVLALFGAGMLLYNICIKKPSREELYVNKVAAAAESVQASAAMEADEKSGSVEEGENEL